MKKEKRAWALNSFCRTKSDPIYFQFYSHISCWGRLSFHMWVLICVCSCAATHDISLCPAPLLFTLPPSSSCTASTSSPIRTCIWAAKTFPQNLATYAFHSYFTLLLTICTWMRIVAIVIACDVVVLLTVKHIGICCTSPNVQVCDKREVMWANYVNGKLQNVHTSHIYIHTYMHTYIHVCIHTNTCINMCLRAESAENYDVNMKNTKCTQIACGEWVHRHTWRKSNKYIVNVKNYKMW